MDKDYINNNKDFDLSIAIPKGYLFEECREILDVAGFETGTLYEESRKLMVLSKKDRIRYVISRPMDVPVYVEQGACDIGFAGKDVLLELENDVIELLDLKKGKCRIIIATLKGNTEKVKEEYEHFGSIKVATKYPNIAKNYFETKGMQVEIIKLYGSVELAPLLGIAQEILDITATGKTLRENDLVEMESVYDSTTRLIANTVCYRTKYDRISRFVSRLKPAIQ